MARNYILDSVFNHEHSELLGNFVRRQRRKAPAKFDRPVLRPGAIFIGLLLTAERYVPAVSRISQENRWVPCKTRILKRLVWDEWVIMCMNDEGRDTNARDKW